MSSANGSTVCWGVSSYCGGQRDLQRS
jgi:hypothetical protein